MDRINPGDIVKHFKYETLTEEEKLRNMYLYKVLAIAVHTETKEPMVVYQALYGETPHLGMDYRTYVRPYRLFMSEVDRDKYPDIKQQYRFEKVVPKSAKEE